MIQDITSVAKAKINKYIYVSLALLVRSCFPVCFSCSLIPSHLQREHPMATPGQMALTAPHPARDSADTEAPPRLKSAALVEQGNNFWHIERSLVDEPTRWLQEI